MKNFKNAFKAILICTTFLFIGCESQEGECFSCNEGVNLWAHQNKNEILKMGRNDITKLNPEKQRAAFRVMTANKRKQLWLDKLDYLYNYVNTKDENLLFPK